MFDACTCTHTRTHPTCEQAHAHPMAAALPANPTPAPAAPTPAPAGDGSQQSAQAAVTLVDDQETTGDNEGAEKYNFNSMLASSFATGVTSLILEFM